LGDKDGAEDQMIYDGGLTQSGVGGIDGDVDRWFNNVGNAASFPDISDTSDATKVTYYTPRIAGIQVGASLHSGRRQLYAADQQLGPGCGR
jgi:hypothetical protein